MIFMKPLISIIVPVYNSEKYIKKCLRSIQNQTYENLQVLVVDDGSTDYSWHLIRQFSKKDSRFISIQQENRGAAAARNAALSRAEGKYYTFIDADDYVGRDYIRSMAEYAVRNRSDLVICGFTMVYPNKKKKEVIPHMYKKGQREEWAYRICASWGRMYRSEFWKEHGLKFANMPRAGAEDVSLAIYANAMAANICVIPMADYYYVQHWESATHSKNGKQPAFSFPFSDFYDMHKKLKRCTLTNSRMFYNMGVVKFLAQFEFDVYRYAGKDKRKKFEEYVCRLLDDDWECISMEWKKYGKAIQLPLLHKLAIGLFIYKYRRIKRC